MNERQAFIAAIRANPRDDAARLVYADWLDENGDSDKDRATAEFIRLSCARPGSTVMPRRAFEWLWNEVRDADDKWVIVGNWRRLVPSAMAMHVRLPTDASDPFSRRTGRVVCSFMRVSVRPASRRSSQNHNAFVNFEFNRGFLTGLGSQQGLVARVLRKAVVVDQPLYDGRTGATA